MENQENNNLNELDQLKAQYETLKQQFEQQEIVNDRLMKSSIRNSTDFYTRFRRRQFILYPVAAIAFFLLIRWYQGNDLSLMLFWGLYCVVCFAIELWMTRKLHTKSSENNDLLTLSQQARSFKKFFSIYTILNYSPGVILVMGLLLYHTDGFFCLPNLTAFAIMVALVLIAFVVVGVVEIRYKTRPCEEIVRQIEALEGTSENMKTSFNKQQKFLCAAMMIVFIGFDIWAFMIGTLHLELPPQWLNEKYELVYKRGADNIVTEGSLGIWELDADTVAISSEMMEGKPVVQRIVCSSPRRKAADEPIPMIVYLTPEASRLWYEFTTKAKGHRAALYLDGVMIQDWQIQCGIDNGTFFIMKEWASREEMEAFCERLIRQ